MVGPCAQAQGQGLRLPLKGSEGVAGSPQF